MIVVSERHDSFWHTYFIHVPLFYHILLITQTAAEVVLMPCLVFITVSVGMVLLVRTCKVICKPQLDVLVGDESIARPFIDPLAQH